MKTTRIQKRFITMSVPGRTEDGSDTAWFCYDRSRSRSVRCESYEAARTLARKLNADAK